MEEHLKNIAGRSCSSCGGINEEKNIFCIHCGTIQKSKKIQSKRWAVLLGLGVLIFGVVIIFWWMSNLNSKFVGRVNGEGITQKEFSKRVERAKRFYDLRYRQGLFEENGGKENLNRLKRIVFEEMVAEKILLQEAKKAGYTSAPQEEIEKQLIAIKEKHGFSDDDLQKKMGISIDELREDLRKGWIISHFIEKTLLKGGSQNGDVAFAQWFDKVRANSKIETYEKFEPLFTAKASCCRTGCGGGIAQPLDPGIEREAKSKAIEYYEKKTQKKGVDARVTNFGCHIQVDIIEAGKVVLSLTYNGKDVQEI